MESEHITDRASGAVVIVILVALAMVAEAAVVAVVSAVAVAVTVTVAVAVVSVVVMLGQDAQQQQRRRQQQQWWWSQWWWRGLIPKLRTTPMICRASSHCWPTGQFFWAKTGNGALETLPNHTCCDLVSPGCMLFACFGKPSWWKAKSLTRF